MNGAPVVKDARQEARDLRAKEQRKATLVGAATNFVLSVAQVIIGILGNSQALVADAMHTFSDLLSDGVAYWAARHSHIAPDQDHPYGHGRFETAATLGIATLLTLVGIGISWAAGDRLFNADAQVVPDPITLYTAGFTILAKEGLYHYTIMMARRLKSEMLRASAWHHRSDALSSVIVFVGVGGSLMGLRYLDSIAALAVGLMILRIAWELGFGAFRELTDAGLANEKVGRIRQLIEEVGGVNAIHMLRTRTSGGLASVDVHLLVEPRVSVSEGHMVGQEVMDRLRREIEEVTDVTVHIDPEDDEAGTPSEGLPLRNEAEALLAERWGEFPEYQGRERLLLHYLGGRMEVDLYLPLEHFRSADETAALRRRLEQALEGGAARFGPVRVYYG